MTSLDTGPTAGTFHEISRGRRAKNVVAATVVTAAFLLALLPLTWILFNVVTKGFRALTTVAWWSRSQNGILPEQVGGGVYHALYGTLVQVFIAEKHWEGAGGLELTDEIKVTIAGTGCQLLLGRNHDLFNEVDSIVVYPSTVALPEAPRSF